MTVTHIKVSIHFVRSHFGSSHFGSSQELKSIQELPASSIPHCSRRDGAHPQEDQARHPRALLQGGRDLHEARPQGLQAQGAGGRPEAARDDGDVVPGLTQLPAGEVRLAVALLPALLLPCRVLGLSLACTAFTNEVQCTFPRGLAPTLHTYT